MATSGWRRPVGNLLHRQGTWQQASDYHYEALSVFRELGDRHNEGSALGSLAIVLVDLGHWDHAIDNYQQALGIFQELGDRHLEGLTFGSLGNILARQGHRDHTREYWRAALAIFEQLGASEATAVEQALARLDRPQPSP
jgi:tetratricopeptide (TPR) repeat protein